MLPLPTKGVGTSPSGEEMLIAMKRLSLGSLSDWIEGSIAFVDATISKSEIIDILKEENVFPDQDAASAKVDDAYAELRRRKRHLGKICPFEFDGLRLKRLCQWQDTPEYSFCLMVSMNPYYREPLRKQFGQDYTDQGLLFERLTVESVGKLGWTTYSTGWSKTASVNFVENIEALASHLGEKSYGKRVKRWTSKNAKDGGLDVVCHVPFPDGRSGRPLFFLQCASGEKWKAKKTTPNLDIWNKLLDLSTKPVLGISIPFALLTHDFRKEAVSPQLALLMDRPRVCSPIPGLAPKWCSAELMILLNGWTQLRLDVLKGLSVKGG